MVLLPYHSMGRIKRTTADLRKLADEHLKYEIDCLFGTALAMNAIRQESATDFIGTAVRNALLESFAIHARTLLQFLYSESPNGDWVIAEDFFDVPETWFQGRPQKSFRLGELTRRVAKEVAHLSYDRLLVRPEKKPWNIVHLAKEFAIVLAVFNQLVSSERITQGLRDSILQGIDLTSEITLPREAGQST